MQAQGDVGVFGGVGASQFETDLIKGQLSSALPCDVIKTDRGFVEVICCEAIHVVSRSH